MLLPMMSAAAAEIATGCDGGEAKYLRSCCRTNARIPTKTRFWIMDG